jgi:hypothetical protein
MAEFAALHMAAPIEHTSDGVPRGGSVEEMAGFLYG